MSKLAEIRSWPQAACPLCGSPGTLRYEGMSDRLFGTPGVWGMRICQRLECGVHWLDPMPDPQDLPKAYEDYFTHGAVHQNPVTSHELEAGVARDTIQRIDSALWFPLRLLRSWHIGRGTELNFVKQYLPDRAKGRLLEIGCGDGSLLSLLVREGWKAEGLDFDSAAVAVARARGLEVREGTLEKQAFDSDCFDAIVMVHVIEHVPDPARLIQECARILKPGGVIVVITPNIASLGHRWFGKSWLHLDPPRHLHIFSPRALHDMGMAAGLMAVTCSTTAYHAHVSLQGSMGIKRNGRFSLGAPRTILDILLTRGLQFIQWIAIASRIRPDAGDELVMVAKRNQAS